MCNNFDKAKGCWWYHNKPEKYPWIFQGYEIPFSDLKSKNGVMHSGQEYFNYFS
ncbi:5198_t:CDS:1, partial [Gigaspora rosea]